MKARTLTLSMLLFSATAAGSPARQDSAPPPYDSVTFQGDRTEHPIELARAQVLVDGVHVNGEGPFRFVLDTGAEGAGRIDATLVEKLGLQPAGQVRGGDGTDRAGPMMDQYELESLSVAGLRAEGVRVLSRDYNSQAAAVRGHVDGILGIGLFAELLLTIDYPAEVLRIERGELPEPDGREVLALLPDTRVPAITVEVAGETHQAYLDSGAMGPLSLPGELEEALPLKGEARTVGQARTVSGAFDIRAATLDDEIALGRHVTFRPRVLFGGPLRDVIVSGEVLSEYALTLDQANGRARFLRHGWSAHEAAPARSSLPRAEERVPMMSVNGRPTIEAMIGDKGPYRFVLDTGAGANVITASLAKELELAVVGETTLGVPGGEARVPAWEHVLPAVTVGSATFHDVPAMSWELPSIMGALGKVQGIVGLPLFFDLLTTLDTPNGELVLSHDWLPTEATAYTLDESGLPEFKIDVAGHAIPAHLDTGNPSQLVVPASVASKLPWAEEPRILGRGRTASGEFVIRGAPLEGDANIAGLLLHNPMVTIQEWNEFANIGGGLLRDRALTFDQAHRRLLIGPLQEAR